MFNFLKKSTISTLVFLFIFGTLFIIPKKTNAIFGFGDIVFDIPNTVQGTISAVSNPVTAFATTPITAVSSALNTGKEFGGDTLAYLAAQSMLRIITAQTVNWINSGFKGNPAFVTDPGKFFRNQGDILANKFIGEDIMNQLCTPFQFQVRLALAKTYLQEQQPPACTLGRIAENYENFIDNFEDGGWANWFSLTVNSNNNPYGSYYKAQDALSQKIEINTNKYNKQLDYGKGFLSFERCKVRAGSTAPTPGANPATGFTREVCSVRAPIGQCISKQNANGTGLRNYCNGECIESKTVRVDSNGNEIPVTTSGGNDTSGNTVPEGECAEKETVTPGTVIEGALQKTFGSGVARLEMADELNEVFSALLNQVFTRVVSSAMNGLRGLSQKGPDEARSVTDSVLGRPAPTPTNRSNYQTCVDSGRNPVDCEDLSALNDIANAIPASAQEFVNPTDVRSQDVINEQEIRQSVRDEVDYYSNDPSLRPIGGTCIANGICDAGETSESCPSDCGPGPGGGPTEP